jgi:hypothetical protein
MSRLGKGRGSAENPQNRFDILRFERDPESIDPDDLDPAPSTELPDRHGFWGGGDRYPASEAEIRRFCNQSSW